MLPATTGNGASMKTGLRLSMGAVVLLACSSVSVEYTPLNSPPRPVQSTTADQVEVLTTTPPSRKHIEIGTIKGMHDSITSDEDMFKAMKVEAAERGCNALVVTQRGGPVAIASCVVYTDQ
jgi:hypothetical protein